MPHNIVIRLILGQRMSKNSKTGDTEIAFTWNSVVYITLLCSFQWFLVKIWTLATVFIKKAQNALSIL